MALHRLIKFELNEYFQPKENSSTNLEKQMERKKTLTAVEQVDCNSSHILHRKPPHMVLHKPEKTQETMEE